MSAEERLREDAARIARLAVSSAPCAEQDAHERDIAFAFGPGSQFAAGVSVPTEPGAPRCGICDAPESDLYHGPEPCALCPHASPHHPFVPTEPGAPDPWGINPEYNRGWADGWREGKAAAARLASRPVPAPEPSARLDVERLHGALAKALPVSFGTPYVEDERRDVERIAAAYEAAATQETR